MLSSGSIVALYSSIALCIAFSFFDSWVQPNNICGCSLSTGGKFQMLLQFRWPVDHGGYICSLVNVIDFVFLVILKISIASLAIIIILFFLGPFGH